MPELLSASSQPRYLQLAEGLKQAIEKGVFSAGGALPSIRQAAHTHNLSINTVIAAYRSLEDQGFIEARPQSGFVVKNQLPGLMRTFEKGTEDSTASASVLSLIEQAFAMQQDPSFLNLSLACPDKHSDLFPREKLGRIMSRLVRQQASLISSYALPPGSLTLRRQISRRMQNLGVLSHVDDICLTHGCMEAINLALRAVTKPGDSVGVESPTYFYLIPLLNDLGLKLVELPTHAETGLCVDDIEPLLAEKKLQALICMPNLHNPLGCSMPLEAKKKLAKLVNQYHVPLIEDGLYAELQSHGTLPAVQSLDENGWVIFCSSFSKTLAPDFRIGWVHSTRFNRKIRQLKSLYSIAESQFLSETLGQFLEAGGYDYHLRKLRKSYAKNMNVAQALIADYFPEGTKATKPDGGYLFWLELPEPIDTYVLYQQLVRDKISLIPGRLYSASGRFSNAVRISCCNPIDERYRAGFARVGEKARELLASS
ncbi:PLP-dependent aminotransferase family protein [Paenalcaligenes sp. Me131]|uniref:aminotransferase-like domain-containing protein n=1 Tax=Paenalcaligenes sp. Me131 TaxID=3392636 RepID=UPI003D290690